MPLTRELDATLTFVLAGGSRKELEPLTLRRARAAVPFAGTYRLIDFALSNVIHSGLRRVHVLTPRRARSLEEHLRFGWSFLPRRLEQFISIRPAAHKGSGEWYPGSANALQQNLDAIAQAGPRHVLVLWGEQVYRMDYGALLAEHLESDADATVATLTPPEGVRPPFGWVRAAADGELRAVGGGEEGPPSGAETAMGVFLFRAEELLARLTASAELGGEASHDLLQDLVAGALADGKRVRAYRYSGPSPDERPYWRDVATLDAYYRANLELVRSDPPLSLDDIEWRTYTLRRDDPPARTVTAGSPARVDDSLVGAGSIVRGSRVRGSILGGRVRTGEGAEVEDSILLTGVRVGPGARVRRAIVDKWVEIPPGIEIGHDLDRDGDRFTVTDSGIVVIPNGYRF